MKKLTIGMIIKNESENLRRCLSSIKPLLDNIDSELVIVDTGSSDNSVEIAKEFTDRVYDFVWIDDFAAARNESLKYATGEWFMYLDGDEFLDNPSELIDFFNSGEYKKYDCASYIVRNFSEKNSEEFYSDGFVLRVFKRTEDAKFFGRVHEAVNNENMSSLKMLSKTAFKHWGYCIEKDNEKYKAKLLNYEQLLQKEISENPNNSLRYSQLAAIYYGKSDVEPDNETENIRKAVEYLEKGISVEKRNDLKCAYYKNISRMFFNSKKIEECGKYCDLYFDLKGKSKLGIIGSDLDMYFYRGYSCFQKADYDVSATSFKKYTELYEKMQTGSFMTTELLTIGNLTNVQAYLRLALNKLLEAYIKSKNIVGFDKFVDKYATQQDKVNPKAVFVRIDLEFEVLDITEDETRIDKIAKKYSQACENSDKYITEKLEERFKNCENKKKFLEIAMKSCNLDLNYKNLLKLRYADITKSEIDWSCLEFFYAKDGYIDPSYGDLMYFSIKYGVSFDDLATLVYYDRFSEYTDALSVGEEEVEKALYSRINEDLSESDVSACIIFIELCRKYMLGNFASQSERLNLFKRYAEISFEYISLILNMDNLDENSAYVLPISLREMYLSGFAYIELADGNYERAVEYTDKIKEFSPEFALLSNALYAYSIKNSIRALVKNGDIKSAKTVAEQYRITYGEDDELDNIFD